MGLVDSLFGKVARKLSKEKERHTLYEIDIVFLIVLTLIRLWVMFCRLSDCWSYVYEWTLMSMSAWRTNLGMVGDEKAKSEVKR